MPISIDYEVHWHDHPSYEDSRWILMSLIMLPGVQVRLLIGHRGPVELSSVFVELSWME